MLVGREAESAELAAALSSGRDGSASAGSAQRTSEAAGTVDTFCLDGIGYWHQWGDAGGKYGAAEWSNPEREEHFAQFTLIDAYDALVGETGFDGFIGRVKSACVRSLR